MSMEFAQLKIGVETKETLEAAKNLKKLSDSAKKAEVATKGQTEAANKNKRATKEQARATDILGKETDQYAASATRATTATRAMGGAAAMSKRAIIGAATGLLALVAAGAGLRNGVATIVSFDSAMSKVAAITRATDSELKKLRDTAKQLGATTEFTASDAADGLAFLGMAGFDANEAISALPATLDLATASQIGLGQAADIASNVLSGFGMAAADAGQAIDIMAAISTRANTDIPQLGNAISLVGPVAAATGQSLEEVAAAIGILSDAGIQGSRAGTSLRTAISALLDPSSKAKAALETMGLTVEDVNPATVALTDIIDKFAQGGLNAAQAVQIFGREGAAGILAVTQRSGDFKKLAVAMEDVKDEAKTMADVLRKNLGGDIDTLVSATQALFIELGEAGLTGALRGIIQTSTKVVQQLAKLVNGTSEFETEVKLATAAVTGLVVAMNSGLLISFGGFILRAGAAAAAAGGLASASGIASGAMFILRGAMMLLGGPVTIAIGLITAAATAAYLFRDKIFGVKKPTYDAAAGTDALNTALNTFNKDESADAATNALDIAAANRQMAASALDAAENTLKNARANVAAYQAAQNIAGNAMTFGSMGGSMSTTMDGGESQASLQAKRRLEAATDALDKAEGNLNRTIDEQNRAFATVTANLMGWTAENVNAAAIAALLEDGIDDDTRAVGALIAELGTLDTNGLDNLSVAAIDLVRTLGLSEDAARRLNNEMNKGTGIPEEKDPNAATPTVLGFGEIGKMPKVAEPGLAFGDMESYANQPDSPQRDAYLARQKALEDGNTATSRSGGGTKAEATKTVEEMEEAYEGLLASIDPVFAAAQRLEGQQKILNDALAAGAIDGDQFKAAMDKLDDSLEDVNSTAQQVGDSIASTFTSIVTGASSAKDAIAGLLNQLGDMFINQAFQGMFSGMTGGGSGFGDFMSSLGFNAKGTDNWKGGVTVVGEEGPEIVNLPQGTKINSTKKSKAMLERPDLYSMFGVEAPGVAANASGQTSGAGSGSGSRATFSDSASLARVPPPVIVIEPSRVGPSEPRIPREPDRQFDRSGVTAAPAMAQAAAPPVIEVQNYNYFDRDKFVGDYMESPAGRSKTINIVDEEGGR